MIFLPNWEVGKALLRILFRQPKGKLKGLGELKNWAGKGPLGTIKGLFGLPNY